MTALDFYKERLKDRGFSEKQIKDLTDHKDLPWLQFAEDYHNKQLILSGVSNCTDWMVTYRDNDGELYKIVITAKDEDEVIIKFIEDYEGLEWNTIKKIV